jgi:hypothetical protein
VTLPPGARVRLFAPAIGWSGEPVTLH